jgi:uncharacterized protein (DUF1800 family)
VWGARVNFTTDAEMLREFMELFTIGLYKLNPDGTHMKDKLGNDINTFDNFDIMELAHVWTGFMPNPERLNQEINTGPFAKNGIDPTYLELSVLAPYQVEEIRGTHPLRTIFAS